MKDLIDSTSQITREKKAKTMTNLHLYVFYIIFCRIIINIIIFNIKRKSCILSNEKFDFLHDLLEKIPESEPEKVEKRGRPRGVAKISDSPNNNNNVSINNNGNGTQDNGNNSESALSKRGRGRPKKSNSKGESDILDSNEVDPVIQPANIPTLPPLPVQMQEAVVHPPIINLPPVAQFQMGNNFGSFTEYNSFVNPFPQQMANADNYDEEEEDY